MRHVGDRLTAEDVYRLLSDNPHDLVYRTGVDRRATWVSPSSIEVLGFEPEELVGTIVDELVHPDDWVASNEVRQALRAGEVLEEARQETGPPLRVRCKDGAYRWMSVIGTPFLDDEGRPAGIVGRIRDVDAATRAEKRQESLINGLVDPLLRARPHRDEQGRVVDFEIVDANDLALEYVQVARERLVGARLAAEAPHQGDGLLQLLAAAADGEPVALDDFEHVGPGGRRWLDIRATPSDGEVVVTWRDTTTRHLAEQHLADSEELYRLVTDDVADAVVRFDSGGTIRWVSPSFEELSGYPVDEVIGTWGLSMRTAEQIAREPDRPVPQVSDDPSGTAHFELTRRDGTLRWVSVRWRPFTSASGDDGYVAVLRDIHDRVVAEERLAHEMGHDPLTGLANRRLAVARIARRLGATRPGHDLALLSLGVDRLTAVNQALGYAAGDEVLRVIALRISAAVGALDRVARVAGDEFAVLHPDLTHPSAAGACAEAILEAVRGPIDLGGQIVEPTVSAGVAIGRDGDDAEDLLRQASLAMRHAKDAGRNRWRFVDPTLAADARRRFDLERRLRDAIDDGELVPWFQPVVDLATGRLCGYEALVRWVTPDGVVPPDEFLPVAEDTKLVVGIDLAVLERSLEVLEAHPELHVAVNVSATSLDDDGYVARALLALAEHPEAATRLMLEITETALAADDVASTMELFVGLGARWYVDDFGTGYSSISHLRDLPVAGLKLDRSFTAGIATGDERSISLAHGLAGLARGLGLDTVAEGVEDEEQCTVLRAQGWRLAQGWLFGHPAPLPPP